jgi:hypothetical protein
MSIKLHENLFSVSYLLLADRQTYVALFQLFVARALKGTFDACSQVSFVSSVFMSLAGRSLEACDGAL